MDKRGIEFNLTIVAILIVIVVGLALVVWFTLSKFTALTGEEGLGKGEEAAKTGILGLDWDALTKGEQEKLEKKDPKDAAKAKLDTAQAYSDSGNYNRAIELAQEVFINPPSTELGDRAKRIIDEAESKRILSEQKQELIEEKESLIEREEKELGLDEYRKRFEDLINKENVVIGGKIPKNSIVNFEFFEETFHGFYTLLIDIEKLTEENKALEKKDAYLKLKANTYLHYVKLASLRGYPNNAKQFYDKFKDDAGLITKNKYGTIDPVLHEISYYRYTVYYNLGSDYYEEAYLDAREFYNRFDKLGEDTDFSDYIKEKYHELYFKISSFEKQILEFCKSDFAQESEKNCRSRNNDFLGQEVTKKEAQQYPGFVCYYDYDHGDDCRSCTELKKCTYLMGGDDPWIQQCSDDPCGVGCYPDEQEDDCLKEIQ